MSSDADIGSDSDGTSADTILKELCLLRCSSCGKDTRDNSQIISPLGSANFSSFCASEVTDTAAESSIVEVPSFSDTPQSLICQDRFSSRQLSSDSSKHFRERNIFFNELSDSRLFCNPWFKRLQNIVSRSNESTESFLPYRLQQIDRESFSCASQVDSRYQLNSTGTDPPDFESHWITRAVGLTLSDRSQQTSLRSESEDSNSVDCLLRERCSSPDCACDKRFRNTTKVLHKSRRKLKYTGRPRSVASQVTETIHGLKLTGWDGQIIIKEEGSDFNLDPNRDVRADSRESVPNVFDLCRVSSLSDQSSDSALTFLKKCSDSNLLNSLGLKQDPSLLQSKMVVSSKENNDGKNSKGQMVETYGKLLHKIEKLKKMTSWKSKKRKNKLKYTLEGAEFTEEHLEHNCHSGNVKGKLAERVDEIRNREVDHLSCGDAPAIFAQYKEDSSLTEAKRNQPECKQSNIQEEQKCKTCEIGIQSVHSVMSESFMTTVETSSDQINLQDAKGCPFNNNIHTSALHISKDMTELKTNCLSKSTGDNKKIRRVRPESAVSIGTCSLVKDVDKSLSSLGDRETQDEILEHLRQINSLIERESCASNSTHRLCKSERNLGFEANKLAMPKRLTKVDRDNKEVLNKRKEGRVYWAVTKVTVYPDSCRTYEVMRLSRRRPQNVPSSSETVFVLLPNK